MMSVSPSRPIAPVVATVHGGKKKRRRKRCYYDYTVKQKISIIQKAYSKPKYVAKFAREYGLARDTDIRKWKKILGKLKEKAQVNPHAKSVHEDPVVEDRAFEKEVKD
jgi:transposase-like protein